MVRAPARGKRIIMRVCIIRFVGIEQARDGVLTSQYTPTWLIVAQVEELIQIPVLNVSRLTGAIVGDQGLPLFLSLIGLCLPLGFFGDPVTLLIRTLKFRRRAPF